MAYEQRRDNEGASFKNDRKREGKKDPDYTGNMTVEGKSYWLDTWIKNNPKSPDYDPTKKTFLSHSLRPKEPRNEFPKPNPQQARRGAPPPPPPSDKSAPEQNAALDHMIDDDLPEIPF